MGESSSSTSDSDEDTSEEERIIHEDEKIPIGTVTTHRLAVCNLDWVQIRAVDILVVLSSFISPNCITSVTIYPTDYGLEKMKEEEKYGPIDVWEVKKNDD